MAVTVLEAAPDDSCSDPEAASEMVQSVTLMFGAISVPADVSPPGEIVQIVPASSDVTETVVARSAWVSTP